MKKVGIGGTPRTVSTRHRRVLLTLASDTGSQAVTLALLIGILAVTRSPVELIAETSLALVLVRFLIERFSRPRLVLTVRPIRKYLHQVFDTEIKFAVSVPALTFLLAWPLPHETVGVFLVANFVAQFAFLSLARSILLHLTEAGKPNDSEAARNRVIVVGTGEKGKAIADMILHSPELETAIYGFFDYHRTGLWRYRDLPLIGHPDRLERFAAENQLDAVVLAVEPEDMPHTAGLFAVAEKMGVTVSLIPDIYRPSIARAVPASLNGTPTVAYRAVPENRMALAAKNLMDKIGAVVGLMIAAPIMIAAAIAIKVESRGPVFFKQRRSGINGRPFPLFKFRTMCDGAEHKRDQLSDLNEMSGPVFKIRNDPRVTRVGRFLRKYSIDEIPQFFNVLRGEMSLVGPRPPLPSEVAKFEPWQRRKLSVRPGLTCIWQVNGRNQIDFEDWMKLDLEYIDNWSLWLDTKILARTFPTVIKGNGAA